MGSKSSTSRSLSPIGLRYHLSHTPAPSSPSFPCPSCHSPLTDGNIAKKLQCPCGKTLLRAENGSVTLQPSPKLTSFDDLFTLRTQALPSDLPELRSLTLGIFTESVPRRYLRDGEIDWNRLFSEVVEPYMTKRVRSMGLNDLIVMEGVRGKVVACEPPCGSVSAGTSIQGYQQLSRRELIRAQIAVLAPNHLTGREFESIILPYFRANKHQHLHQDQYVYLPQLPFVVLAAEPTDGVISPNTQLFYEPRGLVPYASLTLAIQVPQEWTSFFHEAVLKAYFEGWYRGVYPGKEWEIAGLRGQVRNGARLGYVTRETRIEVVEPVAERLVLRMQGPDGRVILVEDPRLQLLQQLLYLSEMMEQSGIRGASDRTGADIASSLPTRPITSLSTNEDTNKCTICMCEYELQEEVTTLPCCKTYSVHFFHSACIQEWLSRSQLCPMCKINIQESVSQ